MDHNTGLHKMKNKIAVVTLMIDIEYVLVAESNADIRISLSRPDFSLCVLSNFINLSMFGFR